MNDGHQDEAPSSTWPDPAVAGAATLDLSVIVLGAGVATAPAVRSLQRQTLAQSRYEVRLSPRLDAPAVNEAIAGALGRLLCFVAADVELDVAALERHVAAHSNASSRRAVLGAVEWVGLSLRPLAWTLDRLGLAGCQHAPGRGGSVPGEALTLAHVSVPRSALASVGGCDERLAVFFDADLGTRLAAAGVNCVVDPTIRATRPSSADLGGWFERCRRMGGDWLELRAKHGELAPPSWLRNSGLDVDDREALLERLLAGADGHRRAAVALRDSLAEVETLLARDPASADATLDRLGADLSDLLLRLTRHELLRGFVNRSLGGTADALDACVKSVSRGAAVLVLNGSGSETSIAPVLANLPRRAELIVGVNAGTPSDELPGDPRLVRLDLPGGAPPAVLQQALLGATSADFFVLLDGTCAPTLAEWDALELTLGTIPQIGACNVDGEPNGTLAKATLCTTLPSAIVAARRDVIEREKNGSGPFLERLARRGYRFATATAAQEPAECAS